MEALGSVSQIYMFILLALLFVGSGLAIWSFLNFLADKAIGKPASVRKKQVILNNGPNQEQGSVKKTYGGFIMVNNGWIKLAVFSFVGIIASVIILGFITTTNPMNTASNTHLQHQQQGMNQSGYTQQMQGGMNVDAQMGNMQMQGNMNGNMNGNMGSQMQGNKNGNMGQQNEYMMMQQQIYQMQMQMNQMQQQLGMSNGNMSGNMQSQPGGMSSMPQSSGGMSSMPQSSGGMGMGMMPMMNMGGSMSSMPQSNSSMPQSNSSMPQSSSGSGGGMGMM